MVLDRQKFFDAVRHSPFSGLTTAQVSGTDTILDVWQERYQARTPVAQLADCLATTFHETATTMQPIKEIGSHAYFMRMYDRSGPRKALALRLGNMNIGDGPLFCGRGDVQLTGRRNYRNATDKLRVLGFIASDVDFERSPDLVMDPRNAALIMFEGMEAGWFTGDTLDKEIHDGEHAEFVRARRIINGTDRAEKIAGYADAFLKGLEGAMT